MANQKYFTVTKTLPDGTRKYYRGKTKEEAEAKRRKDVELLSNGFELGNPTIKELGELWFILFKDTDDLHILSKESIRGTLDRYVYPNLGKKKIKEIKPVDIRITMKKLSDYSKSTQSKVLQAVRGICAFAVENNYILKTPVPGNLKAGGAATGEIIPLSDDQCRTLLTSVKGTRAFLFVELLLFTGLRKGEALGLMWNDIDFKKATLSVNRSVVYPLRNKAGEINTDLKTFSARRTIPVVPQLMADLKAAKDKSTSLYIFSMKDGKFLTESAFRRMWDLVDPNGFHVHPHQLRHTCVTRWIENGMDVKEVQYLAGHAKPEITMHIYAHYRKEQRFEETAAKMTQIASSL